MTSKTDLCILLFGDRKPKHVDHEEDARVYVEAIAEIKKLRAENEALKAAIPEGCTPADARVLREANHGLAAELHSVRAEVEALRALLGDAADELESVYDEMFPWREECPDEMRRYENEMRLVNRIINALRGEGE